LSRTFVLGDPHGNYRGLLQVLKLSNFDKEEDILICVGDVADGWPEVAEVIEELLTIKNLVPIMGNHDFWLKNYLEHGWQPQIWLSQGGLATYGSYITHPDLKEKHRDFYFPKCTFYYIDCNNNAYVHGGYASKSGLGTDAQDTYMWDRELWDKAKSAHSGGKLKMTSMYNKLFIGHTSLGYTLPQKRCNVWNVDTGSGWEGCLTLMNVETEEYFMSDQTKMLYPEVKGR